MQLCAACASASAGDVPLCALCSVAAAAPVRMVPGIGPVRQARLADSGITTVGGLWTALLGNVAAAAEVSVATAMEWRAAAHQIMTRRDAGDATSSSTSSNDGVDLVAAGQAPRPALSDAFAWSPTDQDTPRPLEPAPAPTWHIFPADAPVRRPVRPWAAALAVLAVGLALFAGAWLVLDLDGDGVTAWRELQLGTTAWQADSDRDGMLDGAELAQRTDPLRMDSDGDNLGDGVELRLLLSPLTQDSDNDLVPDDLELAWGSDPRATDSDHDGLADGRELACGLVAGESAELVRAACTPATDCDRDGISALVDADDDADERRDGDEAGHERCVADLDGDGVLDGREGNAACIGRTDCDRDGVADGEEAASRFSPLDSDTFDSGLTDLVTFNFERQGQAFTADGDGDAIPDGWETTSGVIDWGAFTPAPGRKDLLVEFIRVEGPVSGGRIGTVEFAPAYEAVRDAMRREGGIAMQYQETRVRLEPEPALDVLLAWQDPTYQDVIKRGKYVGNPYVTTIVLVPAVLQPATGPAFAGVADGFMSLLSAVDYGDFAKHSFAGSRESNGTRTQVAFDLYPAEEEVIMAGHSDTAYWSTTGDIIVEQSYGYYTWTPRWFATRPLLHLEDGSTIQLTITEVVVEQGLLASTILHELGHNLGLCHSHLPDCNAAFTPADRRDQAASTMSYDSAPGAMHFLASEWAQVQTDIRCPAGSTLHLLATGATLDNVTKDKYSGGGLRRCDHAKQLELVAQFKPEPGIAPYNQPVEYDDLAAPPWTSTAPRTTLFAAGALAVVLAASGLTYAWRHRVRQRRREGEIGA